MLPNIVLVENFQAKKVVKTIQKKEKSAGDQKVIYCDR
jgi:hypothetical protein